MLWKRETPRPSHSLFEHQYSTTVKCAHLCVFWTRSLHNNGLSKDTGEAIKARAFESDAETIPLP